MLKKILKYSGKILVIIMLSLLVLSFALWGVGDVLQSGGSNAVAVVGDEEISEREFRNLMQREITKLKYQFGDNINDEIINSLQINKRVIKQLVNERLVSIAANDLGVIVGDKPALKEIASVPQFINTDGTFNAPAFQQFLYSQNESEGRFIHNLKSTISRQILTDSITANPIIPNEILHAMYKHENEKRSGKTIVVPGDYVAKISQPNENELIEYYEKAKAKFAAPEQRDISYILLDKEAVDAEAEVTEEDIKQSYEDRITEFTQPERRKVLHVIVDDKAKADSIYKALEEGNTFLATAKEFAKQDEEETNLGVIIKEDLINEIVEPTFSLEKGKYSKPIESTLGWHVVQVEKIVPPVSISYGKVKEQIKQELLDGRAEEIIYKMSTQIEDAFAGGATLEEAAKDNGLEVIRVEGISDNGKVSGKKAKLPSSSKFLTSAFSGQEGSELNLVSSIEENLAFSIRVDNIVPARVKALDEVKGKVISAWKVDKKISLARDIARTVAENLEVSGADIIAAKKSVLKGTELTNLAKAEFQGKIEIKNLGPVSRFPDRSDTSTPTGLIEEFFSLKEGGATGYHEAADGSFVVAQLTKILPATVGEDADRLDETNLTLVYNFSADIWEQYLNYLSFKYPVRIFEDKITSN